MNPDLFNSVTPTLEEARATVTGSGEDIVDTKGFTDILFLVEISAVAAADADNYLLFTVEESDDDDFSDGTETLVTDSARLSSDAASKVIASGVVLKIANTNQANTLVSFGYKPGTKRYVRIKWTETSTASAVFSLISLKNGARHLD